MMVSLPPRSVFTFFNNGEFSLDRDTPEFARSKRIFELSAGGSIEFEMDFRIKLTGTGQLNLFYAAGKDSSDLFSTLQPRKVIEIDFSL